MSIALASEGREGMGTGEGERGGARTEEGVTEVETGEDFLVGTWTDDLVDERVARVGFGRIQEILLFFFTVDIGGGGGRGRGRAGWGDGSRVRRMKKKRLIRRRRMVKGSVQKGLAEIPHLHVWSREQGRRLFFVVVIIVIIVLAVVVRGRRKSRGRG